MNGINIGSQTRSMHPLTVEGNGRVSRRIIPIAICLLPGVVTLLWFCSTLAAIVNYHFAYPAYDQFRSYSFYLGLPFPENAIQLENGHRPILPALLRLAEIHWFSANQILQTTVGALAAAATLAVLAWLLIRERSMPAVNRAAGVLFATLAIFWLGNARMLIHGNELAHVYFVTLFLVLALIAVDSERRRSPMIFGTLAGLCCLAAVFSFGTGMATFGAVLLVGFVLRLRMRDLLIPFLFLAFALAAYVFTLPGDNGVRYGLVFDPLGNLAAILRWLSAPWMRAWLGNGGAPLEPWLQTSMDTDLMGHSLIVSAQWIALPFGAGSAMTLGILVGAAGISGYACLLFHAWRARGKINSTRVIGLGLSTFGICTAATICLARVDLFQVAPEQVFADRYLPWSCLFWLGLALYGIAGNAMSSLRRQMAVALCSLIAAAILFPSHRSLAGWSATVSREVRQSAVAAQLGVWDARHFENAAVSVEQAETSLRLLRERHLSMFGEPAFALVERGWRAPESSPPPLPGAFAHLTRTFVDPHSGRQIAAIEGLISRVEGARHPVMAIVDASGNLRGLAQPTFRGFGKHALVIKKTKNRGFDGYVLDAKPGESLRVLILDDNGLQALASIEFRI